MKGLIAHLQVSWLKTKMHIWLPNCKSTIFSLKLLFITLLFQCPKSGICGSTTGTPLLLCIRGDFRLLWINSRKKEEEFCAYVRLFTPEVQKKQLDGYTNATVRATWFLDLAALCRAVRPSFARKSRCAPPFFRALMTSTTLSRWAAKVSGVSAEGQEQHNIPSEFAHTRPYPQQMWIQVQYILPVICSNRLDFLICKILLPGGRTNSWNQLAEFMGGRKTWQDFYFLTPGLLWSSGSAWLGLFR